MLGVVLLRAILRESVVLKAIESKVRDHQMFQKPTNKEEFLQWLSSAMSAESFVQCSLGKPAKDGTLKRALMRPVTVKEGDRILLVMTEARRDLTRTVTAREAAAYVGEHLGTSFGSATVKTLERDLFLEITKSGDAQIGTAKPSVTAAPAKTHDREKKFSLSPKLPWLRDLGITNGMGEIRSEMRDKFIQIERFVNIVRPEAEKLPDNMKSISAVDVGSGKSYLTFALYQLLINLFPNTEVQVRGVEKRGDLVRLSNEVAMKHELTGLRFVHGLAEEVVREKLEVVVALHACDTATDDAIRLALRGNAKLICVAPCCHKYVRKKMHPNGVLATLTRHGIHAERIGETITDALRALYLEAEGYETKVVEFIDKSHTAKNTMILASMRSNPSPHAAEQLAALRTAAGLPDFYLDLFPVVPPNPPKV